MADSDTDILGTNIDDIDDIPTEAEREYEPKLEDPEIKSVENSNTMNYVKLLSELEDEKNAGSENSQRFVKDTIPQPESEIFVNRQN